MSAYQKNERKRALKQKRLAAKRAFNRGAALRIRYLAKRLYLNMWRHDRENMNLWRREGLSTRADLPLKWWRSRQYKRSAIRFLGPGAL
jgi:hypothetical protein